MTSPLYNRILLWHKLVAQTTGGLALCSAKGKLPREEALRWVAALRNVSDEIQSVLDGTGFILDTHGRRVVGSGTETRASPKFFDSTGGSDEVGQDARTTGTQSGRQSSPKPAGGPTVAKRSVRVATRKRQ